MREDDETTFTRFLDRIVSADSQRYLYKFPEEDPLRIPLTAVLCIFMTIALALLFILGDGVNPSGFASITENPMLGPSFYTLVRFGANVAQEIRRDFYSNAWRLVSAIWLHAGLVHWFINIGSLMILGPKVDRWYGASRVFFIYFVSGVGSNVAEALVRVQYAASVGVSGSICGMIGAILSDTLKNWRCLNHPSMQLGTWTLQIVIFFALGLIPALNNIAHVGGFVTGIFCGFLVLPKLCGNSKITLDRSDLISRLYYVFIGAAGLSLIFGYGLYALSNGESWSSEWTCHLFLSNTC